MHAPAASTRTTGGAAEEFRDQINRRQAFGQSVAMSAVGAEKHVVGAQVRADSHGDGFLSHVCVAGALNEAALVTTSQLLLGWPDELHGAIELQPVGFGSGGHFVAPMVAPALQARFPPSMGMSAPVIQLDASEARKTARPLMSSGWPSLPAGMPLWNFSRRAGCSAMRCSRLGLTTCAGRMAFTRTPRPAHSVLSSRVICATAPIAIL